MPAGRPPRPGGPRERLGEGGGAHAGGRGCPSGPVSAAFTRGRCDKRGAQPPGVPVGGPQSLWLGARHERPGKPRERERPRGEPRAGGLTPACPWVSAKRICAGEEVRTQTGLQSPRPRNDTPRESEQNPKAAQPRSSSFQDFQTYLARTRARTPRGMDSILQGKENRPIENLR